MEINVRKNNLTYNVWGEPTMKKELYEKPQVTTAEIKAEEGFSFGAYQGPLQVEQPLFGICCT
jgi:hypothetical protein